MIPHPSLFACALLIAITVSQTFAQKASHVKSVAVGDSLWNIDIDRSIMIFKEEVQKDPSNHYALNQLAHAYKSAHQYGKAIEIFERLLETPEYKTSVLFFMADAYFYLGDFDQGLVYFEKAINSGFTNLYNSGSWSLANIRSSPYFDDLKRLGKYQLLEKEVFQRAFDPQIQYSSWSPDGKQLVLQAALNGSGSYDLYVLDLVSGELKRLTFTRENEMGPKWSPDGKWIAFHREQLYGGSKEIHLINPDGTKEQQLTDQQGLGVIKSFPSWSPDGKSIVFVGERGVDSNIFQVQLESKEYSQLTDTIGNKNNPSINEYMELIYDVQLVDNSYSIVKKNIQTGEQTILTSDNWWWTPVWMDQGKKIIAGFYETGATMFNQIAVMNADGSEKRVITAYGKDAWFPAISSDSKKVAFASPVNAYFHGGSVLKVLNLETGEMMHHFDLSIH